MSSHSDSFKPSTYIPLLRRFTDERARDWSELKTLYKRVRERSEQSTACGPEGRNAVFRRLMDQVGSIPDQLFEPILGLMVGLFRNEDQLFAPVPDTLDMTMSLKEQVEFAQFLRAREHFLDHEEAVIDTLVDALVTITEGFIGDIEGVEDDVSESLFRVPLHDLLGAPYDDIDATIQLLANDRFVEKGLFVRTFGSMYANICAVNGVSPEVETSRPFKFARDTRFPVSEAVERFLGDTPFERFLTSPIPIDVPYETYFSHMHVVGGSGAGKTQWLQQLVLHHLEHEEGPSLVIVDSQGDLIDKLAHLNHFDPHGGSHHDKLLLITPKDIQHPPSINIFDVARTRHRGYDDATREQVTAGVIQTFDYLFAGLLGADLTAKQSVFFRFVARLMLAIPETFGRNATILDMIDLMDDPTPYLPAIERLPPIQRRFFEHDFNQKTFTQTKEQIRYRLNAILENPTLERLFTSTHTEVDLFEHLNSGSVILIDTAKDFLKGASGNFGRIFISLVLQAILERAAIPEHDRHPTFLIVDEAGEFFDSNIDDLLTEARKYRCGCVFAHQFLGQCSSELRASLAANTSIKLAGGVSTGDARALAPELRTSPEFVLNQRKLHFACHIRNVTPSAITVPVEAGLLEDEAQMNDASYSAFLERNRRRVAGSRSDGTHTASPEPIAANQTNDPDMIDTEGGDW